MRGILLQTREKYNKEYNKRVLPSALISIVGLFLALLTILFGLRPAVLNGFLEGAESPYAMIEAYDKWYGILTVTQVAAPAIVIVCCVTAVAIGRRKPDAGKLYNEQKSRDWNEENAQLYYITYTTNFSVVTSIQPAEP